MFRRSAPPESSRLRAIRRSPGEWWRRRRRWCIAALVFLAVFSTLRALAPADADHALVLAARSDLPAGHVLGEDDLVEVRLGGRHAPEHLPRSSLLGRSLAVPWPAGLPLHSRALAGSDLSGHLPPGRVAVGLSLGREQSASFLRAGDVVDVIVTDASEEVGRPSRVVATDARVLWLGAASDQSSGWLSPGSNGTQPGLVVLSVPRSAAGAVAGAPQRGAVSLVVTGS